MEVSSTNQENIIHDLKSNGERIQLENSKLHSDLRLFSQKAASHHKEKQLLQEEITKIKKVFENKLDYVLNQCNHKIKELQDILIES